MKNLLLALMSIVLFSVSAYAQNPIAIEEVEVPGGIEFIAHSQSDSDVELTFSLSQLKNVKGYKEAVKEIVPAGKSVKLLQIKTSPGYGYKYGIEMMIASPGSKSVANRPSNNDSGNSSLDSGIVLFHKTTCQRCTYAGNYMVENDIPFTPLDIADTENNAILMKKLKEQGFTGRSFQTPVIMVDGEISHSHKNIKKFMTQLASYVK